MTAKIEINCESAGELIAHLHDIINMVKQRSRDNPQHDFEVGTSFENTNCYGTHAVEIYCED